jgi:hypothetical protein
MSVVRRYPLTAFFVLACALSWWPWILYSGGLLPTPIVGFGPFLGALVVLAVTEGKSGVVGLLRRMVRWRVGLQWYAVALLLPIVVTLLAAVFALAPHPWPRWHLGGAGFRGYALPGCSSLTRHS